MKYRGAKAGMEAARLRGPALAGAGSALASRCAWSSPRVPAPWAFQSWREKSSSWVRAGALDCCRKYVIKHWSPLLLGPPGHKAISLPENAFSGLTRCHFDTRSWRVFRASKPNRIERPLSS